MTKKEQVRNAAIAALRENPQGMRTWGLIRAIKKLEPDISEGTIDDCVWKFAKYGDSDIYKPEPGLYKLRSADTASVDEDIRTRIDQQKVKEDDFYIPFANWLKDDLGQCTEALPLGGSAIGRKWGTPDIIGINQPPRKARIQFDAEVVTAEIKLNPSEVITAFGQAVSYRLFSSKVYLALPQDISQEDQSRIEALCMLFGLGLVLFKTDPSDPQFSIRVSAQKHSSDMFYTNEFLDRLEAVNPDLSKKLFAG